MGRVGDAEVGHLAVDGRKSIGVGGQSHFDMVGVETGACGCLRFVTVVGKLLEMDAGIVPAFVNLGAHAPALASFRKKLSTSRLGCNHGFNSTPMIQISHVSIGRGNSPGWEGKVIRHSTAVKYITTGMCRTVAARRPWIRRRQNRM